MKSKVFIVCVVIALVSIGGAVRGQCSREHTDQARQLLSAGMFSKTDELLRPCLQSFDKRTLQEAYYLMAIKCLAQDSAATAEHWVTRLLVNDPGFNASDHDPISFVRLLEKHRSRLSYRTVSSVSRQDESVDQAAAFTIVLSSDEIQRRGYQSLEQAITDLPGFDISRTYGATTASIYMRGYRSVGNGGFQLLVDGVPVNDLWTNLALLSYQYPLSNIKRIEAVYGPAGLFYGANASQGAIHIITKTPKELVYKSFPGVIYTMENATYKTRSADLTLAGQYKSLGLSVTIKKYNSIEQKLSAFAPYDFDTAFYNSVNYRELLGITENAASWAKTYQADSHPYFQVVRSATGDTQAVMLTPWGERVARHLDKYGVLEGINQHTPRHTNLSDHWYYGARVHAGDLVLGFETWKHKQGALNAYTDQYYAAAINSNAWVYSQSHIFARYRAKLSERVALSHISYYRQGGTDAATRLVYMDNYSNGGMPLHKLMTNTLGRWNNLYLYQLSRQFSTETMMCFQPTQHLAMTAGTQYTITSHPSHYRVLLNPTLNQDIVTEGGYYPTDTLSGSSMEVSNISIYFQADYRVFPWLSINAGLRAEHQSERRLAGYGTVVYGRYAFIAKHKNMTFKAIYANGRNEWLNDPEPLRYAYRSITNTRQKPDYVNNLELVASHNLVSGGIVAVSIFNTWTGKPDGITPYAKTNYAQSGSLMGRQLRILGVNSYIQHRWRFLTTNINYSYCHPMARMKMGNDDQGWVRVADIASHRVNVSAGTYLMKKLEFSLRFNYMSQRPAGTGTTVPRNMDSFPGVATLHASFSYKNLQPGLNLQATINNLTNASYADPGIGAADGSYYSSFIPQHGLVFSIRATYNLRNSFVESF